MNNATICLCPKRFQITPTVSVICTRSYDKANIDVIIRRMESKDVDAADTVCRKAFNTFLGFDMLGDADYVRTRSQYVTDLYVVKLNNKIIGSNSATNLCSFQISLFNDN